MWQLMHMQSCQLLRQRFVFFNNNVITNIYFEAIIQRIELKIICDHQANIIKIFLSGWFPLKVMVTWQIL